MGGYGRRLRECEWWVGEGRGGEGRGGKGMTVGPGRGEGRGGDTREEVRGKGGGEEGWGRPRGGMTQGGSYILYFLPRYNTSPLLVTPFVTEWVEFSQNALYLAGK